MKRLAFYITVIFLISSCARLSVIEEREPHVLQTVVPPERSQPDLHVLNYKNRESGANIAPWLRRYLEEGIIGVESMSAYQGQYIFIAKTSSRNMMVINQWMENYSYERDFSRLVAERIQSRMNRNLPDLSPEVYYGTHYARTVRAAYEARFSGNRRLDDSWVLAIAKGQTETTPLQEQRYWGFILISIPRTVLETQISELLSGLLSSATNRSATRSQNAAFAQLRENFFEQF